MTDETQELKNKIAELEKELKEAKEQNNDDTGFDELKAKYEKIIEEKDESIKELNKQVEETNKKVDSTVGNLNDEIKARLEATEEYKKLIATVEQLEKEKAEASVDAVIQKGLALPAQKEALKKWCLNDSDSFVEYFDNAQPIIEVDKQKSKKINANLSQLVDYFKN